MTKKNKIDLIEKLKKIQKMEWNKKKWPNKSSPFLVVLFIAIILATYYLFTQWTTEEINDKATLNKVASNYSSWMYSKIIIDWDKLLATRKETKQKMIW